MVRQSDGFVWWGRAVSVSTLIRYAICFFAVLFGSTSAWSGPSYSISTGSQAGTYIWIGEDLAKYVAKPAGLTLQVQTSKGSVDNFKRLSSDKNTVFALVHSDLIQAYFEQAQNNRKLAEMIAPLRVVLPLYDGEVHFIVRKDSPLKWVHEIQDKKINVGALGSGDAATSTMLYQALFGVALSEANVTTYGHDSVLQRLLTEPANLDVAIIVPGQPAPLLLGLEPSVEKNFRLLQLDESHPSTQRAAKTYSSGVIKSSSYPQWIKQDMATFSVKTYLLTRDSSDTTKQQYIRQFTKALCSNFRNLQQQGHPKWRQVSLDLPPLIVGLHYHALAERELRQCTIRLPQITTPCVWSQKAMGLCVS
jgi:uncharacterized protein